MVSSGCPTCAFLLGVHPGVGVLSRRPADAARRCDPNFGSKRRNPLAPAAAAPHELRPPQHLERLVYFRTSFCWVLNDPACGSICISPQTEEAEHLFRFPDPLNILFPEVSL